MRIKVKLILSFFFVIFSAGLIGYFWIGGIAQNDLKESIGQGAVVLGQETLDKIDITIYGYIDRWRAYLYNAETKELLAELDRDFKKNADTPDYIQQKNQEWISAGADEITPFMKGLIENDLSFKLRERVAYYEEKEGHSVFSEVFVTNAEGVNLAQTGKTTDYYQADEEWWQLAKEKGLHIEDVSYDESSKTYSINICLRIDDDSGIFLGVMKIALNFQEIINTIKELEAAAGAVQGTDFGFDLPDTAHFILATSQGKLIYSTKQYNFGEDINNTILSKFFEGDEKLHKDYTVTIDKRVQPATQELFANAHSRGYKDFPNLGWFLVTQYDTKEIFRPVYELRNLIIYIVVGMMALFLAIAFYLSSIIVGPIKKLYEGTIIIEQGNLNYKVATKNQDEVGQLSRSFDKMTASIKKSWDEVDKKVQDQTKEIRQANEKLTDQQRALLNVLDDVEKEKDKVVVERDKVDTIVHSIGDGVFVINSNYEIILFNEKASEISGFAPEEALGKKYFEVLKFVYEKDDKVNDKFVQDAMGKGEITTMANHTVLIAKDGKRVPVADSAAPLKDKNGKVTGCVVVFRNVAREREINQMKSDFVSVASHQLKTPLTAIGWIAERLLGNKAGKLQKKQKDYLLDIYDSNKRMIRLVNDLLSVSRLEEGKIRIELKLLQVEEIVDGLIQEQKDLREKCKCQVTFEGPKEKLPLIVFDESLLRQVVHNLLTNAIRYSVAGGHVSVKLEKRTKDFILTVADDGIGIPKDKQHRIFEKFFRADNAQKKQTDGTGLGLYITKLIVETMGGKIWFKSAENKGTTFYVSLPLKGMKNNVGQLTD